MALNEKFTKKISPPASDSSGRSAPSHSQASADHPPLSSGMGPGIPEFPRFEDLVAMGDPQKVMEEVNKICYLMYPAANCNPVQAVFNRDYAAVLPTAVKISFRNLSSRV